MNLKPSNFLIKDNKVILTDFGVIFHFLIRNDYPLCETEIID